VASLPLRDIKAVLAAHPEASSSVDASGCTALHWAVSIGAPLVVVAALAAANPAAVSQKDIYDRTPLDWASATTPEGVEALLRRSTKAAH